MYFLEEVGKLKKFLVLQYRIILLRQFLIEIMKKIVDESGQLIKTKPDSKEELECNIKRVANKVTEINKHNLIQIFGQSKINNLPYNRNTALNLDLNRSIAFMKELEKEVSKGLKDSELLQEYFHLEEQDAKVFSESFTYLVIKEKSPNTITADPNIFTNIEKVIGLLKKIGHISNDRDKNYSKEAYLRLVGFLLYEYMTDSSNGIIIKLIYHKLETSLKTNPSATFNLFNLFFRQKTKFRTISDILTKDRVFHYLDRLKPELVILGQELSSEIQQEISKTLNKIHNVADISEAVDQVLYSTKNPYQLMIEYLKPDLLQKINELMQFREESSIMMPQILTNDIDHTLELYRNMYEGEYWLLLGFLICLEKIIQNGSFNEKCILTENSVKKREKKLINLNPANHSLILFNNYVKPRNVDAHNKVSFSKDMKEIHIRGESSILNVDELSQIVREKAKVLLTCHSFIEFFEIFISNFIID